MSQSLTFVRAANPPTKKKDLPARKPIKGGVRAKHAQ
jgi:hypothetical protein